jgi:hypothetical protein
MFGCVATIALVLAGCGNTTENLIEEGIEQAIEKDSGEDIELDFDRDDGLRIETDEGTMTIDEDGSFVIEGEDGEMLTGEATNEGFTVTDGDETVVLDVDENDGQVTAETEDGSLSAGPGVPDGWPSSVPRPMGLNDLNGSTISADGQTLMTVSGTAPQGAAEYFDNYEAALEGEGFSSTSYFESDGFRQGTYEGAEYTVSLVGDDDSSNIAVTLMSVAN